MTAAASTATPFEQRQLRDVLGTFVTGVTVVTTRDAFGVAHGVTANSFSSVSLDPPLVLWSQSLTSKSYPAFRDSEHFAVNILADDQIALSNHFAKSREDKFNGIAHAAGLGGSPVLDGAAAHLECVKVAAYPSGDHVVYIGRVERIGHSNRRALAFSGGKYMVAYSHDLGPTSLQLGNTRPAHLDGIRLATAALPRIARDLGEHTLGLAVWGNHGPTAIHWEPSSQPVSDQLRTGLVMPITRSATGRAFAAFLPEDTTRAFVDEDLRAAPIGQVDLAEGRLRFAEKIARIQARGIARAVGSTPSPLHQVPVNAFSVPIRDAGGDMIMALSLTSSASRLRPDWDGDVPRGLAEAALEISTGLGYAAGAPSREPSSVHGNS
ncbi:MAG: flavin reductase [Variovorax sp.]